ncbi:MAG TPA: tRNA (guanosine(37)-N1)-methyltransferase TrmD [Candidatus Paceibacterota bacterium]
MTFHIITLFPSMFDSYLKESILARAIKEKKVQILFYNPRDFAKPTKKQNTKEKPYFRVDDKPYGGGPGMVMQAEPVLKAIEAAMKKLKLKAKSYLSAGRGSRAMSRDKLKARLIWLTPSGKQFDTKYARNIAQKYEHVIIVCGRYEGIDERVKKIYKMEDVSVGPFILTGGELPAMIIADSVSRQIKGVLGNFDSREESRMSSSEVYTRPETLRWKSKKYTVPRILLSGNHAEIDKWRADRRLKKDHKSSRNSK